MGECFPLFGRQTVKSSGAPSIKHSSSYYNGLLKILGLYSKILSLHIGNYRWFFIFFFELFGIFRPFSRNQEQTRVTIFKPGSLLFSRVSLLCLTLCKCRGGGRGMTPPPRGALTLPFCPRLPWLLGPSSLFLRAQAWPGLADLYSFFFFLIYFYFLI